MTPLRPFAMAAIRFVSTLACVGSARSVAEVR